MPKLKTKWEGPVMTLVERLTRPKKRTIGQDESVIKPKTGWGNIKKTITERKRKQEETIRGTGGLRSTIRKANGG